MVATSQGAAVKIISAPVLYDEMLSQLTDLNDSSSKRGISENVLRWFDIVPTYRKTKRLSGDGRFVTIVSNERSVQPVLQRVAIRRRQMTRVDANSNPPTRRRARQLRSERHCGFRVQWRTCSDSALVETPIWSTVVGECIRS